MRVLRHVARIACAASVLALTACGAHRAGTVARPVAAPTSSTPTAPATPTTTSTRPAAPSTTGPALAPISASPLAFAWSVQVSGRSVTVGGSWSGRDRTLTSADVAVDPQISTGAKPGSGVLAYDGSVLTADGRPVAPGTAPDEADFTVGVYSTNGDVPRSCGGHPVAQTRAAPPMTLTFARPGTYEVQMRTTSCAGAHIDTKTFTVS